MYDAAAHHKALFLRTQRLLGRYLRRYWYRAVQAGGQLSDLFVTVEEVSAELEIGAVEPPFDLPEMGPLEAELASLRTKARKQRGRRTKRPLPAAQLMALTGLTEDALELLLVQSTLQQAPGLLRTATMAWADFAVKQPTAGFLVELLADDEAHRTRLTQALAPDAPLRRLHLLTLGEDRRWQPSTPLLQRPALVPDAVTRFLSGQPVVGEDYPAGCLTLEARGLRPDELVLHEGTARLTQLLESLCAETDKAPLLLVGEAGGGRRTVTRAYALAAERVLAVVNLALLPWELAPFEAQLAATLRDGRLAGGVVLLRCAAFTDPTDRRLGILGRLIEAMRVPVVLTMTEAQVPLMTGVLPNAHVAKLTDGPAPARTALYSQLIERNDFTLDDESLRGLVDTYTLRPGDLARALRDVRLTSGDAKTLPAQPFDRAVRRQIRTHLSALASHVTTTQTWGDLVIDPELKDSLDEIMAHAKHRARVFDDWGFARKLGSKGRGLSCLFSGPPGTGKTMCAALIAKALDLDLYQVDLSRIVDKYVGETEKNLGRLFDEAARVPVVLLFDEADSLFATRTKVESSNDRYANLEVNYLLQKMETYQGISILTTNLGTGIDQAFKRRLRFRLHFDLPGPDERLVLWQKMLPEGMEVAGDVDWWALAKRWEMSGALIRNAMVRAAFLAAARDTPLTGVMLKQAARAELMEMGRLGS